MSLFILLLLNLSFRGPEIIHAVNPDCACQVFSQAQNKERGTFTSPDYPKSYPRGIDCLLYTFIAAPEQIVELTFADFDVHKTHTDCIHGDFLKLFPHVEHDEVNGYSKGAGTLCGGREAVPPVIYSGGRALVLEFHSEPGPPINVSGFFGFYRFVDKKLYKTDGALLKDTLCDYVFTSSGSSNSGHFYSPRFPSSYPKNMKCSYNFASIHGGRIRLVFQELNLQKDDTSCLYQDDVIKVYDGSSTISPLITILCNEGSEIEILSTGSNLLVEFIAKSSWPGQGFKALFQFQENNSTPSVAPILPPTPSALVSPAKDSQERSDSVLEKIVYKKGAILCSKSKLFGSSCDAAFNSDSSKNGTFTSANYPGSYPPRSHCRYDFLGRGKERIQVVFQDFNLFHPGDDVKECDNIDSLQAFVHIEGRMEKIDSFCGSTIPKSIMSNGPRLMLEFRGIYSSRYVRGFKATYYFLENFGITSGKQLSEFPCAFVYNSTDARNGTFSSPNYPGPYPRDTECHYLFQGTNKEKVHIQFTYFDVEGVLPCETVSASDYVEFSNFMARDRKYNRHCGQLKEFHVESDRKFFRVTFKSNDRLDGTGFKANYHFFEEVELTTYRPNHNGTNKINDGSSLHCVLLFIISIVMVFEYKQITNNY